MSLAGLQFQFPPLEGWEVRLQVTYVAPAEPPTAALPGDVEQQVEPRTNLVVSRMPTEEGDPQAAWSTFIRTTAPAIPGLDLVGEPQAFVFRDGADGFAGTIVFEVQSVPLTQLHVFRIDAGLLTQIVATVDEVDHEERLRDLAELIAGFSPT